MTTLLKWALERRYSIILLAIVFVQLFPAVTCALLVLDTCRHGPTRGFAAAAAVLVGVAALALVTGNATGPALSVGVISALSGVAMGAMLHGSRSLELAFQGTVLSAFLLTMLLVLIGPSPATLVAPLIEELAGLMEAGGATGAQLAAIRDLDPVMLLAFVVGGIVLQVLAALMLGYAWFGMVEPAARFGPQFRSLRLGRILGILSMVVLVLGLVTNWAVVGAVTALAVIAFLFQGLAVMHAWSHAKRWHPIAVGLVYLTIVTPISGFTVMALSATGLLDNFFSLRRPLAGGV